MQGGEGRTQSAGRLTDQTPLVTQTDVLDVSVPAFILRTASFQCPPAMFSLFCSFLS